MHTKQHVIHWNISIVTTILLSVVTVASLNLWFDPYFVFHTTDRYPTVTANERFNKVEHILHNPSKYDAFLIGSSRMGVYDPDWLKTSRPGRHFYNLSVFSGDSLDMLKMLKTLKSSGVRIKEVILGIDIFPFIEKKRVRDVSMRHHPLVSMVSPFHYFLRYLFTFSPLHIMKVIEDTKDNRIFEYDFEEKGNWHAVKFERLIHENHKGFMASQFLKKEHSKEPLHWEKRRFDELASLYQWLIQEEIKTTAFIHPVSSYQMANAEDGTKDFFISKIRSIIPTAYEFLDDNSMTDDLNEYYDPKHYRPSIAERIINILYPTPKD